MNPITVITTIILILIWITINLILIINPYLNLSYALFIRDLIAAFRSIY
jgi:hypothetical protein